MDTSTKCLVLLYVPDENAYERVIFDSYTNNNGPFQNETEYILKKKSKKNKNLYRYFVFEYDHFFIKYLLKWFNFQSDRKRTKQKKKRKEQQGEKKRRKKKKKKKIE